MFISLIKIITLKDYYYYNTILIVLTIINTVNTSFITSFTNQITTYIKRDLNINFIKSLFFNNNSDIVFNFNKQTSDIEI